MPSPRSRRRTTTWPDDGRADETYTCDVYQLDPTKTYRTRAEREHLAHLLNRATTCDKPTWQIWRDHDWTSLLATT